MESVGLMFKVAALGLVIGMMTATMTGVQAITIDTVVIGDPGNPDDTTGYGGVSYTYAIGKYEVNLNQYTEFLNAVDPLGLNPNGICNASMATNSSSAGIDFALSAAPGSKYSVIGSGNRPVTYVRWFDAARFSNWMHNGATAGASTETGAYTLNDATSGIIEKNPGATWWIPSEDEWYKAAYYDPGAGWPPDDYWGYPTRSDSAPGNTIGAGTNQANYYNGVYSVTQSPTYSSSQNYLTDGGAFSASGSYFGTFDQGGNVYEWNDAVIYGSARGLRGGSWNFSDSSLQSSIRYSSPAGEFNSVGFRVASVPEPSIAVLMLMGGGAWMLWRRRTKQKPVSPH